MAKSPLIAFDPLSASFADNPYRVYDQLRSQDKPYYFADQDMHLLSRFDDISMVTLHPKAVRSLIGYVSPEELAAAQRKANWHDMPYHQRFVQCSMLDSDGEKHERLRSHLFKSFTPKSVSNLEPLIQKFVDTLLDQLSSHDQIDFVADFAAHIPGYAIGQLLGVPADDCTRLRIWSELVVQYFDVNRTDERKRIAENATKEFYEYLTELKQQRRKKPKPDLISQMIEDESQGVYSEDEFISACMLILMAGHGSTIDVLSSGMLTLLNFPDAMRSLREDSSLIPTAIQEIFRYEPPLPFFHRHVLSDIEIRGHFYPAGTTFGLLYSAANRDPKQFENPNKFDISRKPNRHLSFGRGLHLCLGNHLARLNMKIIFNTLWQRFSEIQLLEKPAYKRGLSVRGPESLMLRLR